MSFESSFTAFKNRIVRQLNTLPTLIGNDMVNFALDNFRRQGYQGAAFNSWPKRAKKDKGKPRTVLVKTGRLMRGNKFRASSSTVTYYNDTPYASIHNFGGVINRAARSENFVRNRYSRGKRGKMFGGMGAFKKGTTAGQGLSFKAYRINMPQRQFIGRSPVLLTKLRNTSLNHINQAIRR
ncbi:phage virion morphogenesis protein [Olivibacter sp. 47]|uniref:phage virion morphogenesis protein n=1 Tax=Olivibacter sp. 47 TaxID=3056486 RepID=UPI0025A3AFCE|nr:phage virion morphogenesis protein [Olivibacter sp. 47]MDM8176857.1 phage virion morphogenesis protein [Olivibacter sp. 47]